MHDSLRVRRARIASQLKLDNAVLLVGAGEPISIPGGADRTYPFVAHSDYFFLADADTPGGVIAYDPAEGPDAGWVSFVPEVTEAQRVWEGIEDVPGIPISKLGAWLAARSSRPVVNLGVSLNGTKSANPATLSVQEQFTHARRPKDSAQLERIRAAAAATAAGFQTAAELIRPDVTERELQIEIEASFFRAGGTRTGYDTIVAIGANSAVLHFMPTGRSARDGDLVLIDAGAEVHRYTADVTRTYVAGKPRGIAKDLYAIVLEAEERAITRCMPGTEWREIHLRCAVELTAGLVSLGLMRGNPAGLVEREAHLLFFPHGIGHMVGLGVRDAGGMFPGRKKSESPSLKNLRTDLPLEPGYVMTVEPGLYFIPALLNDRARRERFKDAVVWDKVDPLIGTGGIRIEDNILITTSAPENLTTAIPKDWASAVRM
jgi:Xaa-Pro aminopeptidase